VTKRTHLKIKVGDIVYIERDSQKGFCKITGRKMDPNFLDCYQINGNISAINKYRVSHIGYIKASLQDFFTRKDVMKINPETFKEYYPEYFI
jgi:hypothetical protein